MNDTVQNLDHPVWDLYKLYRRTSCSVRYYAEKLSQYKSWNSIIEIILAISTSTSAVAVLWFWETPLGKEIWQYVLIVSALLAIVKPILKLTESVQQYEEMVTGYRGLENEIEMIVVQVKQSGQYATLHKNKMLEALSKEGELLKKSPEIKTNIKLEEKCETYIDYKLPLANFFVPEDTRDDDV